MTMPRGPKGQERQNLTMRMHMRRFTRLTNAFQRRSRTTLTRRAPHDVLQFRQDTFDAAHVARDCRWREQDALGEFGDIVKLIEAAEAKPAKRGPYKKHRAA